MSSPAPARASGMGGLVLTRELAWVTLGQIAAAAGGLAGVRLLTRKMDPSMYGEFALALTGIALVQQSVGGPISQAVMRYFAAATEEGFLPEYFQAVFRMLRRTSWFVAMLSLATLAGLWISGERRWMAAALLTFATALLTGYNLAFEAVQNADRNRRAVAWHQGLMQWARPLCALATFWWAGVSIQSALGGYAAATSVVVGSQWFFLRRRLGSYFQLSATAATEAGMQIEQRMLTYAWPFASWGLLCWSQLASDRWLLALFHDSAAVGAYAVCYQLGYYPMLLISMTLGGLATPILFKIAGSGDDPARVQSAIRANFLHSFSLLGLTLIATVGAMLFGPAILRAFASAAYVATAKNLPVLVLAGGLFACGQAVSLVLLLEGRSSRMTGVKIGTAILGILFNAVGAYFFSVGGAAWATLGFGLVYLIAMIWLTQHSQSMAWYSGRVNRPVTGA
jgi:O-antigen/teichoic acid export membrane protein